MNDINNCLTNVLTCLLSYLIMTGLIGAGTVKLTRRSKSPGINTKVTMTPARTLIRVDHLKERHMLLYCCHYFVVIDLVF